MQAMMMYTVITRAGQLRLDFDKKSSKKYVRYTDYETSQVGVVLRIKTVLGSVHHSLRWQMML